MLGDTQHKIPRWLFTNKRRTSSGKTGLEHLTSLAEIKARPNLAIFTEYQKSVDEQSDLVDAIMGMYQLDTSSHVEDEEKEERMSTWVNSLTI